MIVPSDADYIDTKFVKLGAKQIDLPFQELASWVSQQFNTKVLNIYFDKIYEDKNRPRLNIVFEYYEEAARFRDSFGSFDSIKQDIIANKFREILISKSQSKKLDTNRLFVIFSSFEPIAREEANNNISAKEIEKLKKELRMKDLWEIYRQFSLTTFFLY